MIKKAKHQRIDAFELWCWRRLLGVPWTARASNQSILKETNPEYSLERQMLKLQRLHCGHLMWRTDSLIWWTWVWAGSRNWWWTEKTGMLQSMGSQSQTRLSDWTELRFSGYQGKSFLHLFPHSFIIYSVTMYWGFTKYQIFCQLLAMIQVEMLSFLFSRSA